MKNTEYAARIERAFTASELESIELEMLNDPDVETLSDCVGIGIIIDQRLETLRLI